MVVRTFQLQDYMEVSTLLENNLSAVFLEKTITVFAKQLYWDSDLIVVEQKNNRIIGVIIGNIRDQQGLLYRITVEGNDQNSEIERALVDSLVRRFQKLKARSISILLDNDTLQKPLFLSLGYTEADFITQ
ncbi:hypothetical protein BSK66_12390 [Paenibacillus odorifer]|uniref:GNAT family N-acetyltransferase n=1 Tax=Paenibacillus TaxID=44249 RepID=UPI0003E2464A|nr:MULTISPECIES: GNAT family N-acetyltransferase [Paenibacillus]ETT54346.1 N-acetyltransferase GCN5 [Paenibacillus sp. FSL H8-237]OME58391.1 hypothetical protein BSK66_12390 [Paenibacillus odorifer]